MKNIYVLPKNTTHQHLYIISNEQIKEGDWALMFDDFGNLFFCDRPQQYLGIEKGHHLNKGLRKVILTTDPQLVKDGVQKIDNYSRDWLVNNPSYGEIKIESYINSNIERIYKIIIPEMYSEEEVRLMLSEIKDMIAIENGFPSWEEFYNWTAREGERPDVVAQIIESVMTEACKRLLIEQKQKS